MMNRLTAVSAITGFVLVAGGSAFAADMPMKAPPAAPAPVYTWTGWYAGVNAGASSQRSIPAVFFNTPCCGSPFTSIQNFSQSHVNTGWVVGYGMEGKLLIPGWTYRIESFYMDLGTLNTTGAG